MQSCNLSLILNFLPHCYDAKTARDFASHSDRPRAIL
jgi:hypothetical protein